MSVPPKGVPGGLAVPDATALVQRLRAGVAEKLSRGVYTPAELEEVRRIERELRAAPDFGPTQDDDIARMHSSWDPLGPHTFTSHRLGVGLPVVTAKKWLRWLAMPVASVTLARQGEFNGAVARLLAGATHGVQSLGDCNEALLRRFDELERRNRELNARCNETAAEIRDLRTRLELDGHSVKSG